MKERRALWSNCKVILSISLQRPNKIYGKIDVVPENAMDILDHFELCINGVIQNKIIGTSSPEFSAEGFTGGEQYQVNVIAYPHDNITDAEPISSNQRVNIRYFLISLQLFEFNRHLRFVEKFNLVHHWLVYALVMMRIPCTYYGDILEIM